MTIFHHPKKTLIRILTLVYLFILAGCSSNTGTETQKTSNVNKFVTADGTGFVKDGKPYVFIGTNYWYGGILGTEGEYGDRERLVKELDNLKTNGMVNLRVLVGAEGNDLVKYTVPQTLVKAPGEYNDSLLLGLDFLLDEMAKREMTAVLYFSNNWPWSGGLGQWLEWFGYGQMPNFHLEQYDWDDYRTYMPQFHRCDSCKAALREYIEKVINHINTVNAVPYKEDPAIFAWEVINEPRPFMHENRSHFDAWLCETVDFIKSLDTNHMVTTGDEGLMGFDLDTAWYEEIQKQLHTDYLTVHIWAKNWSWYNAYEEGEEALPALIERADAYMNWHINNANSLNKPLILEEFGLPRNKHSFSPASSAGLRDAYYSHFFDKLKKLHDSTSFAGINIWTYGGYGRAQHEFWQDGDEFLGDPPQEPQGLNNVFDTDSIISIISAYNTAIR